MRRELSGAAFGLVLAGCAEPAQTTQPADWDAELRLSTAEDLDPSADVFEVQIVAREADIPLREGPTTRLYTYNDTLPGPLPRVRAGGRVVVHFKNELPIPASVGETQHWKVTNQMKWAHRFIFMASSFNRSTKTVSPRVSGRTPRTSPAPVEHSRFGSI